MGSQGHHARRTAVRGDTSRRRWVLLCLLLCPCVLTALAGCASNDPPAVIRPDDDLFHTNPSRRTAAIAEVERKRQTQHVPTLIEMLDDPDPAVRMVAAGTLEELTNRQTAYRPYAPAEERRQHRDEWRAWHQSQSGAPGVPPVVPAREAVSEPLVIRDGVLPPPPPPISHGGIDG